MPRFFSLLISAAGGLFVFWCTNVLVSPNFWASLTANSQLWIFLKLGAAALTFIFLAWVTSKGD